MDRKDLESQAFAHPEDCKFILTCREHSRTDFFRLEPPHSNAVSLPTDVGFHHRKVRRIHSRVDEMGARIDDLEKTVASPYK